MINDVEYASFFFFFLKPADLELPTLLPQLLSAGVIGVCHHTDILSSLLCTYQLFAQLMK